MSRIILLRTALIVAMVLVTEVSGRLNKRSDDSNPLEAVVSHLTQTVEQLQAQVASLTNTVTSAAAKKVALRAYLASSTVVANAPIHMTPLQQEGQGYDSNTGIFTAPFSGWYSVDFQLFPHGNADLILDLYLNQAIVARAHCIEDNGHIMPFTCSSSLSLRVNAGEKLWLQSSHSGDFFYATFDSVFSLLLVTPDA